MLHASHHAENQTIPKTQNKTKTLKPTMLLLLNLCIIPMLTRHLTALPHAIQLHKYIRN